MYTYKNLPIILYHQMICLSLCSVLVSCEEGTFTVTAVVRVPEDKFATWATFQWLGSGTRHIFGEMEMGFHKVIEWELIPEI